MRFKSRSQLKLLAIAGFCIVLYNEYLVYVIQSFRWPNMKCRDESSCTKLLLVADPQLLGEKSEKPPLRYLFNWDSDRYLMKTYHQVVKSVNPDGIIFLGDIMDEGTIASLSQFRRYVERLVDVFPTDYPIKHVWIPGDNDIGGENEPIYPEKVRRFSESFSQPDAVTIKHVDVHKINLITRVYPGSPDEILSNGTPVIVSHMPLLLSPGPFTESIIQKIKPAVIFSAHKHTALHLETTLDTLFVSKVVAITPNDKENIIEIDFEEDNFNEFLVPTCSYRMGVPDMGYGVAFIDKSHLQYSVFWSPGRFPQLHNYLIFLCVVALYFFLIFLFRFCSMLKRWGMCKNRDKIIYSKV